MIEYPAWPKYNDLPSLQIQKNGLCLQLYILQGQNDHVQAEPGSLEVEPEYQIWVG